MKNPLLPFFCFLFCARPQATRTGMFVAVGAGLGVSYTLLKHGKALLQLFLSGNGSGKWAVCVSVYLFIHLFAPMLLIYFNL